ncbi:MAG: MBL fold metallo-hydrolase [Planctomycetes bacterium]|nr:MBL fold metallo-hydrolase [Planctomycetota bacterium]
MDLGFETIGNATLICHDGGPVLATDPWLDGDAYFGSWSLGHEVPAEQRANVAACKYLWISHGHPDHLSIASLEKLRGKVILLPDHVGGRIRRDLEAMGFSTRVLPDGIWVELSPRLKVCCLADYNQDAILLMDLGGRLLVDANDASDRGVGDFLTRTIARYRQSWLLCLTGYGDADMIHFFDEAGARVLPDAAMKVALGPGIAGLLQHYGIKGFIPFSSMHRYQRADSVWANEYATEIDEHRRDFPQGQGIEILPAFARMDLVKEQLAEIRPRELPAVVRQPEEFGDSWTDPLSAEDVAKLRAYFDPIEHLKSFLGAITFRVGGRDTTLDVAPREHRRSIVFALPRASLLAAIGFEVFDDLLIGNFMKTTLVGEWHARNVAGLYPDFTPFVGKYADNGHAKDAGQLRAYFGEYFRRGLMAAGPTPLSQAAFGRAQRYLGGG